MRAYICYDADGTDKMIVEAEQISTQVWDGGRALVKLTNGGRVTRAIHFTKVYFIDKDRTDGAGS